MCLCVSIMSVRLSLTDDVDIDDVSSLTEYIRQRDAVSTGVFRSDSIDDQASYFITAHHLYLHHQDTAYSFIFIHCLEDIPTA